MKKSGKGSGWSRRWFVLNEKSGKVSEFILFDFLLLTEMILFWFKHLTTQQRCLVTAQEVFYRIRTLVKLKILRIWARPHSTGPKS